ncbi:MAG: radical SAM protein [bacterium]
MKIMLVRPNYRGFLIAPPLGLGYLSSFMAAHGERPTILDGLRDGLSNERLVEGCAGADLVGINVMSAYFPEALGLSRKLKARGHTVVLGGPHLAAMALWTLREAGADFAVVGEGELTFLELVRALEEGRDPEGMEGLLTPKTRFLKKRRNIEVLDSLPIPDWQQMDPRKYKVPSGTGENFPAIHIISSRGCLNDCRGCSGASMWGKGFRLRSPGAVIAEMIYLRDEFEVREFRFEDDNIVSVRDHLEGICNLAIERKLDREWGIADTNPINLEVELLGLMKRSGCRYLSFNVESGSAEVLERHFRRIDLDKIEQVVSACKNVGIQVQLRLRLGCPGDSPSSVLETIGFVRRLRPDRVQFSFFGTSPDGPPGNPEFKKMVFDSLGPFITSELVLDDGIYLELGRGA